LNCTVRVVSLIALLHATPARVDVIAIRVGADSDDLRVFFFAPPRQILNALIPGTCPIAAILHA
jgi:hypothetical protein